MLPLGSLLCVPLVSLHLSYLQLGQSTLCTRASRGTLFRLMVGVIGFLLNRCVLNVSASLIMMVRMWTTLIDVAEGFFPYGFPILFKIHVKNKLCNIWSVRSWWTLVWVTHRFLINRLNRWQWIWQLLHFFLILVVFSVKFFLYFVLWLFIFVFALLF